MCLGSALEKKEDESSDPDFSYKDVSQLSEVTDDVYAESMGAATEGENDLKDYNRLVQQTQKRLSLLDGASEPPEESSTAQADEKSDEFIRNFFIKFGMRQTLEAFQQEWYELKANKRLPTQLPEIPEIYRKNAELSDELAVLQEELDEARIIAEKARSTYDKLRKQRDFQKINHRRVQQEKTKLSNDATTQKKKYSELQGTFDELSRKYEATVKEKMLMKLEKDRLIARVENLELSLNQASDDNVGAESIADKGMLSKADTSAAIKPHQTSTKKAQTDGHNSTAAMQFANKTNTPTPIPGRDRYNPAVHETYEAIGSHLSLAKTFKGHLMGVTSLSYNPKKDIIATGSDDTTWKLWSIPNGDLIMSGEGHIDWVGGVEFHPKGNLLATASGDGSVKVWDFVRACCAQTFAEHGQPVWKVAYHDTGDFLLSCSMDHTVKLWDMNMSRSRFTFRGHVDSVNSIQFLPFSQTFVSGSGDKTVAMWDIRTNQCVQTFYGHNNAVNSSKFNIRVSSLGPSGFAAANWRGLAYRVGRQNRVRGLRRHHQDLGRAHGQGGDAVRLGAHLSELRHFRQGVQRRVRGERGRLHQGLQRGHGREGWRAQRPRGLRPGSHLRLPKGRLPHFSRRRLLLPHLAVRPPVTRPVKARHGLARRGKAKQARPGWQGYASPPPDADFNLFAPAANDNKRWKLGYKSQWTGRTV